MDIQGLKDKILQLAIQGKLVEQDKNDEPASALLNRIKEERDKLVREGKIRKPKKLVPIEEEEKPFEIPGSWEWVRLGEVGQIVGGGTPKTSVKEYWEGGTIPWLTPADLSSYKDKYISTGKRSITPLGLKESSAQLMPKGTVLFSSRAPIGYTVIAKNEISTNQGFKSCVPFIIEMNEYLYYYLVYYAKIINENASGTTFKEVSGAEVSNLILPLPPLAEQKRIVEKVDEIFALIDKLDSNKEDLLEVINLTRNQVLQEAIQGKLVEQNPEDEPASVLIQRIKEERDKLVKEGKIRKEKPLSEITEEEKPFEIPEGWEWVRLGDITRICLGLTHRPEYVERGIPFLSVKDISSGSISFSNCRFIEVSKYNSLPEGSKPQKGDVLFGRVGTLGVPSIVDVDFPFGIFVSLGFLRPYIINMNIYLKTFMETKLFFDQVYSNVFGSAQINLNTGWLSNFLVPLPPLAEQKRIVEKVDEIMNMLDELENEIVINI